MDGFPSFTEPEHKSRLSLLATAVVGLLLAGVMLGSVTWAAGWLLVNQDVLDRFPAWWATCLLHSLLVTWAAMWLGIMRKTR